MFALPAPEQTAADRGLDEARLAGADYGYVVVTEYASVGGQEYVVTVAVSLEDVDDSTAALIRRC